LKIEYILTTKNKIKFTLELTASNKQKQKKQFKNWLELYYNNYKVNIIILLFEKILNLRVLNEIW